MSMRMGAAVLAALLTGVALAQFPQPGGGPPGGFGGGRCVGGRAARAPLTRCINPPPRDSSLHERCRRHRASEETGDDNTGRTVLAARAVGA